MRNATGDGEAAGDDSDLTADGDSQAQLLAKAWAPVRFAVRRCFPPPVLAPESTPRCPSRGFRFAQTVQTQWVYYFDTKQLTTTASTVLFSPHTFHRALCTPLQLCFS
jgi:hypothetical protein